MGHSRVVDPGGYKSTSMTVRAYCILGRATVVHASCCFCGACPPDMETLPMLPQNSSFTELQAGSYKSVKTVARGRPSKMLSLQDCGFNLVLG